MDLHFQTGQDFETSHCLSKAVALNAGFKNGPEAATSHKTHSPFFGNFLGFRAIWFRKSKGR
jgi:hypothetical protein